MSQNTYQNGLLTRPRFGQLIRSSIGRMSIVTGAVFLMATSAIGPGFLTQTAVFTEKFGASFAFVIVLSVIIDIGAQVNFWRIIAVSKKRGQDVADAVFPGLGSAIAVIVFLGGLTFNIGNVAGVGLGLNVLFSIDPKSGAVIGAALVTVMFLVKKAARIMDVVVQFLGVLMIAVVTYLMFTTSPPVGDALVRSVFPEHVSNLMFPLVTLVGGTIGAYVMFAGAHRLLDAGICGTENLRQVNSAAGMGVLVTGVMRVILFLAVLGIVAAGYSLDPVDPPASAFQIALGNIGYKFFGVVLFAAALTSTIGASYASVSVISSFHTVFDRYNRLFIIIFMLLSTAIFVTLGKPAVVILILIGAVNGIALPVILGVILLAARNKKIVGSEYKHPTWMMAWGIVALAILVFSAYFAAQGVVDLWS